MLHPPLQHKLNALFFLQAIVVDPEKAYIRLIEHQIIALQETMLFQLGKDNQERVYWAFRDLASMALHADLV